MKINIDRLCQLAGVPSDSTTGTLTEASNRSFHEDPSVSDEAEHRFGAGQLSEAGLTDDEDEDAAKEGDMPEGQDEGDMPEYMQEMDEMDEDPDEVIEISEAELVQELRRAKRMMQEARANHDQNLQEARQIQELVDQEVAAMMKEYNITADWVYGKNKPTFSKKGQVTMMIPGIGFGKIK